VLSDSSLRLFGTAEDHDPRAGRSRSGRTRRRPISRRRLPPWASAPMARNALDRADFLTVRIFCWNSPAAAPYTSCWVSATRPGRKSSAFIMNFRERFPPTPNRDGGRKPRPPPRLTTRCASESLALRAPKKETDWTFRCGFAGLCPMSSHPGPFHWPARRDGRCFATSAPHGSSDPGGVTASVGVKTLHHQYLEWGRNN